MSFQNHKCQIDCTNHDEVINKLEVKSKDLYYFWRNYEWLYNKYYNQPKTMETTQVKEYSQKLRIEQERSQQYRIRIQQYEIKFADLQRTVQNLQHQNKSLQSQNKSLQSQLRNLQGQNKSLSKEVDSLQIQIQRKKQSIPELQADYKRQIKRLKDNIENYKNIQQSLTKNLSQNQILINKLQRQLQSQRSMNQSDKKRYESEILRLQQSLDKIRLEIANQPHPTNFSIDRSALISQGEEITLSFTKIRQQAEQIIQSQMQKTKYELKQEMSNLIFTLTQAELESLLIQVP